MSTPPTRWLALCLMATSLAAAQDHGSRSVTQWRPYLEWSTTNSSWSGNPFDLVATVTFTHEGSGEQRRTEMFYDGNDTWRWRFTGTRSGRWSFSSSSSDSDLNGHSGVIDVSPQDVDGFYQRMSGDKWGWTGSNRAVVPNYVMTSQDPRDYDSNLEIDQHIGEFISGHGFTGLHLNEMGAYWFDFDANGESFSANGHLDRSSTSPDPRTFRALENLIVRTHRAGGAVHIWAWGDSARGENLTATSNTGGINGVVDRRLQRYIAARLGPVPGWSLGYGFDLFEWVSGWQLSSWHDYLHQHMGWAHFLGARGNKNQISGSQLSEDLDYSAYEQHQDQTSWSEWIQTMQDRAGKPSFSEDRFRIRNQGRSKDLKQDGSDTRTLMWTLTMAGGIAGIWGNLWNDASNHTSDPYPNKQQLKTFGVFWNDKGRFLPGLERASNLSNDSNTRVLALRDRSALVLYREGSSSIHVDLSGAPSGLRAVAVDTKQSYQELSLGSLDARSQTLALPYASDWAIAIGFGAVSEPEPQPDQGTQASFTSPASGATLSGSVTVTVTAWDPDAGSADGSGIERVEFALRKDGSSVATHVEHIVSYDWQLDTTAYPDGDYVLRATAHSSSAAGGGSTTISRNVTIASGSDPLPQPDAIAVDDSAAASDGQAVTIRVLANDQAPSGSSLDVVSITQPSGGTAVLNNDDSITYTPTAGFIGDDSFTYTVAAIGSGASSGTLVDLDLTRGSAGGGQVTGGSFQNGWKVTASSGQRIVFDLGRAIDHGYAETVVTVDEQPWAIDGGDDKRNWFALYEESHLEHRSGGDKAYLRTGQSKYGFSRIKAYHQGFNGSELERSHGSTGNWTVDGSTRHTVRFTWGPGYITYDGPGGSYTYRNGEMSRFRYIVLGCDRTYGLCVRGMTYQSLRVVDLDGGTSDSGQVVATDVGTVTVAVSASQPPSDEPPRLAFAQPNAGASFPAGSDLGVVVEASDDGRVAHVELFLDGNLVRRESIAPYEWGTANANVGDAALENLAAGSYTLTAVATDDAGQSSTITRSITIVDDVLPPPETGLIAAVSASSGQPYQIGSLEVGTAVYIDRSYTVDLVPAELAGAEFVRSANDDKNLGGDAVVTLELAADAILLVAHDARSPAPDWLLGWERSDLILGTTDVDRILYQRQFAAGTVTLGANQASSMYNVIALPAPGALIQDIVSASGKAYQVATLAVGVEVYIDRSYVADVVPGILSGAEFVRSANDDKQQGGWPVLAFTLALESDVYVAYDSRQAGSLPTWLSGWTEVTPQLGTTDVDRILLRKRFAAGSRVELGANQAASMYNPVVVPVSRSN